MRLTNFLLFFSSIFLWVHCQSDNSQPSASLSKIAVTWKLIKNDVDESGDNRQFAAITLKNEGAIALTNNWTLYFNQLNGPLTGAITESKVAFKHINGDFYSLKPTDGFTLPAGKEKTIEFKGKYWATKKSDAPIGLYAVFTDKNGKASPPQPINNYTVAPFTKKEQVHRLSLIHISEPTRPY